VAPAAVGRVRAPLGGGQCPGARAGLPHPPRFTEGAEKEKKVKPDILSSIKETERH